MLFRSRALASCAGVQLAVGGREAIGLEVGVEIVESLGSGVKSESPAAGSASLSMPPTSGRLEASDGFGGVELVGAHPQQIAKARTSRARRRNGHLGVIRIFPGPIRRRAGRG